VVDCSDSGAHAYIWKTGAKSTLVAFRGSHNIIDICSYIYAKPTSFSFAERHMNIHHTIYNMFASIEPHIATSLHPKHHVTFCGHSLGGAIAMFAAAYFAHLSNRNLNITCHTFGTPKVGDAAFREWFTEYVPNHVNVRNKYDVVTLYPFNDKYAYIKSVVFDKHSFNPICDHDLDTYIENIVDGLTLRQSL
jgi:triacylglycerol lipase